MPKVSVIVPIFNVEPYLDQCIQSLLSQTFHDIEIILVDDGSPDGCPGMCDTYAIHDSRVRVVHQVNQGVSAARNVGMDMAAGEWISFVDPDDWVESNMVEELLTCAENNNSDICMCSGFSFTKVDDKKREYSFPDVYTLSQADIANLYSTLLHFLYGKRTLEIPMVTHKLYRKSLLLENKVTSPYGMKRHQDVVFNLYAFHYAKKIVFKNIPLYHYRLASNAAEKKGLLDNYFWTRGKRLIDEVALFIEQHGRNDSAKKIVYYSAIRTINFGAVQCFISNISSAQSIQRVKEAASQEPYASTIQKVCLKHLPFEDAVPVLFLRLRMYRLYRFIARTIMRIRRNSADNHGF